MTEVKGLASSPEAIGAVIFDYGLTLVNFSRPTAAIDSAHRAISARVGAVGHPTPSPLAVADVHERVEREVVAHEAAGTLEELDIRLVERRAYADIGLELSDRLLDECSRLIQEAWIEGVRLYADVATTLHRLHETGLRVGLCSNAPYRPSSMHAQLEHLGLAHLLDAAVFSGEVGWRKPSPVLFNACLDALGSSPGESVFVGDRVREDIDGAHACGMRGVLIQRPGEPSAALRSTAPDAVIATLAELPALLPTLQGR